MRKPTVTAKLISAFVFHTQIVMVILDAATILWDFYLTLGMSLDKQELSEGRYCTCIGHNNSKKKIKVKGARSMCTLMTITMQGFTFAATLGVQKIKL